MLKSQSVVIDMNDIHINKVELAQRLKTPIGFENEIIAECEEAVRKACEPKCYALEVDIEAKEPDLVECGVLKLVSRDLYKNLSGCSKGYIMAVTLGMGVDRLVASARVVSPSKSFIIDAVASAFAEAAADYVSAHLANDKKLRPRYSPGYGDLSLEVQSEVLKVLNADKILGIKLGANLLMTPKKSITAVQGVID